MIRALVLLLCLLWGQAWAVDLDVGANGAVGDGVTDDTTNLQTSLTDCSNNGKTCVIASGKNYKITGPIFMWGAGNLRGADSTATITSSQTTKFPFNIGVAVGAAPYTATTVWTGSIRNVTFNITGQTVNGRFIQLYRSRGATIEGNRYYSHNFPMSLTGSGVDGAYLSGAGNYIRERISILNNTVVGEVVDETVQQEGIGLDHFNGAEILYNTVTGVGDDPIGCHICTDVVVKYNTLSSIDGRIYLSNVARSEVSYNSVSRVADATGTFHAGVALIMQTFEDHAGGDAYSDPAPQDFSIHHNTLTLPAGAVDAAGGSISLVGVRTKRRGENSVKYNSIVNNSSSVNRTNYRAVLLTPLDPVVGTWTDPDGLDTTVAKIRNTLTVEGNTASGDYPLSMANTGASSTYYTGTATFKNNVANTFELIYDPNVRNVDNDPVIADWFASPTGGAAASCVDNSANVCTLARAITVSSSGDTIDAACGTYDLTAAALALNKSVYLRPAGNASGCATITSTGATSGYAVQLAGSDHPGAARLGAFTVTTSVAQNQIITISAGAFDSNTELNGTTVTGTNLARHINDANTRGNTKLTNVTLSGTVGTAGTPAGFISSVTPAGGGKRVLIDGLTANLTGGAANFTAVHLERAATATLPFWASVKNSTINATASSTFRAMGVKFNRISSGTDLTGKPAISSIDDNTITVTAASTSTAESKAVEVGSTDATATSNDVKVRRNTLTCYSPVARCLSLAADETTANFAAGIEATENTVSGTYYDGAAVPIGASLGRVSFGRLRRNSITGFGIGIDVSMATDGLIDGNITRGSTVAALFLEGNTSLTAANNAFILDDTVLGAKHGNYGGIGVASQGVTNNAAASLTNNLLQVRSGAGWKFVVVDASQVATFTTNDYDATPTLTNEWSYQGVANDTLAAWKAAQESGALGVAPGFAGGTAPTSVARTTVSAARETVGAGTIPALHARFASESRRAASLNAGGEDFCLNSTSALLGAGTYIGAYILGYGGESFSNPPPIGARGLCRARQPVTSRRATSSRVAN